jgi:hypothetical protein
MNFREKEITQRYEDKDKARGLKDSSPTYKYR